MEKQKITTLKLLAGHFYENGIIISQVVELVGDIRVPLHTGSSHWDALETKRNRQLSHWPLDEAKWTEDMGDILMDDVTCT